MNNSALKLFHELMKKGWIDRNDNSLMWNLVEDNEARDELDQMGIELGFEIIQAQDRIYMVPTQDNDLFLKNNVDYRADIKATNEVRSRDLYLMNYLAIYILFIFFKGEGVDALTRDFTTKEELIKEFTKHCQDVTRDDIDKDDKTDDYSENFHMLAEDWLSKKEGEITSIYVIARQAGESADRKLEKGDYYLSEVEEKNLSFLADKYKKILLVINCGGILDMSVLDKVQGIGAVLHFVQGGEEGGNAFADVVTGKVTPSGKLTDTWARDYEDYPCAKDFGALGDVLNQDYKEGVYVGYRWFDANEIVPRWPFGFGMSYTDFVIKAEDIKATGSKVTVTARVRNEGKSFSGKEVVQLYIAKPNGKLLKERKALAAFSKTGLLAPGEEEVCRLSFDLSDCTSYDEQTACKILEAGEYGLYIGSDSRRNELCGVLTLAQTVIIEKLTNILPLKKDFVEFIPKEKETLYPNEVKHLVIQEGAFTRKNISYDAVKMVFKSEQAKNHLKNLTDKELIELCVGAGFSGLGYNVTPTTVGRTSINLMKKGIPNVNFSDGPAGINLCPKNAYTKHGMPKYIDEIPKDWQWGWIRKMEPIVLAKPGKGYRVYQYMTCFPAVTLQAQTWNPDLIEKVGEAIGTEMVETGITLWLAPGMNIHRNPLCGRNFEYYSEDPLVSGIMASAVTRGVQSHKGLGVTIKHFCCNNQEDKRETVSENVKERALREIYLRGFEIAAKSSKPWAVMTSYNLVNGVHTFASADLCTKVLRNEWGYQGLVMTDWTASEKNPGEHAECILAGNDLIMPGHSGAKKELTAALKSNKISRRDLELAAANVLNVIFTSNVWEEFFLYIQG